MVSLFGRTLLSSACLPDPQNVFTALYARAVQPPFPHLQRLTSRLRGIVPEAGESGTVITVTVPAQTQ